jgi:hypothetical protein
VVIDYGVILAFVLSVITIGMDAAQQFFTLVRRLYQRCLNVIIEVEFEMRGGEAPWIAQVNATTSSLIGIIDFFAQLTLVS